MLTVLNNTPATSCGSCPAHSPAESSTENRHAPIEPAPSLPHLDEEDFLQLLDNYLNPDLDNRRIAELAGLTRAQLQLVIRSSPFQKLLTDEVELTRTRAKACAKAAQARAVAVLDHILDTYAEAERNQPVGRDPAALNIRQRQRESARRAAGLILKISGAIPRSAPRRVPPPPQDANASARSEQRPAPHDSAHDEADLAQLASAAAPLNARTNEALTRRARELLSEHDSQHARGGQCNADDQNTPSEPSTPAARQLRRDNADRPAASTPDHNTTHQTAGLNNQPIAEAASAPLHTPAPPHAEPRAQPPPLHPHRPQP